MADEFKFRIIEEVRRRPILWDCRIDSKKRTRMAIDSEWIDVGKQLNADANDCKIAWRRLRAHFCNESSRMTTRIRRAKAKGKCNQPIYYSPWRFFDALRFVLPGLSHLANFHTNLEPEFDLARSDMKERLESYSFQDKSDSDIEIIESIDAYQTQSAAENYCDSDDMEFIDTKPLNHLQLPREDCMKDSSLAKWSNNTSICQINPINDSQGSKKEEAYFKSYTISLSDIIPESECTEISDKNNVLHSDSVSRKELNFDFSAKETPAASNIIQTCGSGVNLCGTTPNFTTSSEPPDHLDQSTSSVYSFVSPDINDQDYRFLYSFLSHTKLMTDAQKMDFYASMKSSLLEVCPEISSASILYRNLALPKYGDPDKNFLSSFWPFTKSMSLMQNLLFRKKVVDLVQKILSADTNK